MKILIIGFAKLKIMPYMNFYINSIDAKVHDVHLLYWNRDLKEEDTSRYPNLTFHEFKCYQEDEVDKWKKLRSFYLYRKYTLDVINSNEFDFVIVLHTLPGILLYDKLKSKFAGKYILDYRDSTYEGFYPFRKLVGGLIKRSRCTFTSSDAFRRYFPHKCKDKVFTSHNILEDSLNHREYNKIKSDKIRVAFWGQIRHESVNRLLIDRLGNDSRFELHYYGREQNIALALKSYAKQSNYNNVYFHGEYMPEERYEFVKNTDIIHNIYHDTNMLLAMGNKYYDGLIFRIPQICMPYSYMGELCEKQGIGISLDPQNGNFADRLFVFYSSLDRVNFYDSCDIELRRVLLEYRKGCQLLEEIF